MKRYHQQHYKRRRFTIIELMIVCLIFSVAISGAFAMFMAGFRMVFRTEMKLQVNAHMRKAANQLVTDGRNASYFILYDRYDGSRGVIPPSADLVFRDFRTNPAPRFGRRAAGESGNCLVFVFNGENPAPANPASITPIDRIVVYTLDTSNAPDLNAALYFRRGEVVLDPSDPRRTQPVESLIPAASSGPRPANNLKVTIPLVRGMIDGGNVFHNLDGRSIFFNGQFIEGNWANDINAATLKSGSNTFSFTITPRGSV